MNRLFVIAIAPLIVLTACQKSKTATASTQTNIDACALITNKEIQDIQGSPVKDTKPSGNSDGRFRVAQCFYTTETFNRSVSLALTQRDPASASAIDPKTFWKETFGRYEEQTKEQPGDEEKKKSLEREDEERGRPPKKIEGVGDNAYWTASRVGGALYVLKDNAFIRISVGGPESEESKIYKSKALAKKALSRL